MKRSALAVLVAFVTLAAVAAAASSRAPTVAVPQAAKSPAKEVRPLLAVVPGARGPVLGRADKRAIWVARRSPKVRLYNSVRAWAFAPEVSAIALATQPEASDGGAKLHFVEPWLLSRVAVSRLPWGNVAALAWGDDRVNVVLQDPGQIEIVSVDAATHRVSVAAKIDGALVGSDRVGGRLVLLTAPAHGIGTASLVVIEPTGVLRSVTLADTNPWGTKLIDRGADSFAVDGDSLLVTGSTWSDSDRTGMGLAVYGFDGARKLSVFRGDAARVVLAFRGKAYVDLGRPYTATVVDLASGRILADRHAPLARLLIGDGSN